MSGLAGFALGGLVGSLLFGGFGGLGGLGGGFGGIGFFDILLIGAGVLLLVSFLRRRQTQPQPQYAMAGGAPAEAYERAPAWTPQPAASPEASDLERGIGHIRAMDASFDPTAVAADAGRAFTVVQTAVGLRDLSLIRDALTPQMLAILEAQCDRLRSARQTNRIEQVQIRRAEVTEAWQESGRDWVTVSLRASLVDYTVDDGSGNLVDGSRTPQEVEEYWTFTRPVGRNAWQLSAIQS
jgi:predicted lipid-binding transport protein (Tim44 family)